MYTLAALIIGIVLDYLLGDPVYFWHPVRIMGNLIAFLEKGIRKFFQKTKKAELLGGGILVVITVFLSTTIPVLFLFGAYSLHWSAGIFVEACFCYQLLAARSLKTESTKVYIALKEQGLIAGQKAVSMIVGRDTDRLNETGVVKAAVETVAENTSDGVIAPLFYMAIFGIPGGFFYKAVNTMDSMIGYKNKEYLYFGRVAARLDDICNYIPSRLAAIFMVLASALRGFSAKGAWKIWRRDSMNHKSPNSAQTESVCAGALQIQLAGDAWYFGELCKKPTIGDATRPVEKEDIIRANKLMMGTNLVGSIIFLVMRLAVICVIR